MSKKLYNLYESVILEEVDRSKSLLVEGVSINNVTDIINGVETENGIERRTVNITYRDVGGEYTQTRRQLEVYVLGKTKAGHDAIRAYQVGGQSTREDSMENGPGTERGTTGWKTFRLDRIVGWAITKNKWYEPKPRYQQDRDLTFANGSITAQAKFK